jgi:hypothetical protein
MKLAIQYSDGIILGSNDVDKTLVTYDKRIKKTLLPFKAEHYIAAYNTFYDKIIS